MYQSLYPISKFSRPKGSKDKKKRKRRRRLLVGSSLVGASVVGGMYSPGVKRSALYDFHNDDLNIQSKKSKFASRSKYDFISKKGRDINKIVEKVNKDLKVLDDMGLSSDDIKRYKRLITLKRLNRGAKAGALVGLGYGMYNTLKDNKK